jgi:hypothetical protein
MQEDPIIKVHRSSHSVPVIHHLIKLEFFQQVFKKYFTIKFQENLPTGSRGIPREQTDRMKLTVSINTTPTTHCKGD